MKLTKGTKIRIAVQMNKFAYSFIRLQHSANLPTETERHFEANEATNNMERARNQVYKIIETEE